MGIAGCAAAEASTRLARSITRLVPTGITRVPSLLVTNDFPPKVGGIQSYLWELWRRLPPEEVTVLTSEHPDAVAFDKEQPFRVERSLGRVLFPTKKLAREIDRLAAEVAASVIFLDPALPLGLIGRRLRSAAARVVVVHGAEVAIPGRLLGSRSLLARVLHDAAGVVAAGSYPANEAQRAMAGREDLKGLLVPPGVDTQRFRPLGAADRGATRRKFEIDPDVPVVLGLSRLVPRKGFDVLIDAVAELDVPVQLVIAGTGRDRSRLVRRAQRRGVAERVRFVGFVKDEELPSLYGASDVFAMLCRDRWGGLEQEGFGIVFLEAAAAGVPSIAGRSGGAHEAVVHNETGYVVDPRDRHAVGQLIHRLVKDGELCRTMGAAARARAAEQFSYDALAERLAPLASGEIGTLRTLSE